jgi:ATP-dependent RNA circularization protein (DNA/RNA ligase family)
MEEYPKIETLFDRDPKTFKVLEDKIRLPEFFMIQKWRITEKIDGTNVRIWYRTLYEEGKMITKGNTALPFCRRIVEINGRTENASMPTFLMNYLQQTFTVDKFKQAFPDLKDEIEVVLYGEGYGPKIQSGGNYRKDVSCRLFDVKVGKWWLEPDDIESIAEKMGVKTVPSLNDVTIEQAVHLIKSNPFSQVSLQEGGNPDARMEGVVARTVPLLLMRNGERLMWKLKRKDFKL